MPRLALSEDFLADLGALPRPVLKEVQDAVRQFRALSTQDLRSNKGLHLEKLEAARDPRVRTIRITKAYRGVLLAPDDGSDLFTLLRVAHHDVAIKWATKRRFTANNATRGLEVRNVEMIEQMPKFFDAQEKAQAGSHPAPDAGRKPDKLFAAFSDTVLRDLGVDEQVLELARRCTSISDLRLMAPPMLPADQYEVLEFLALGFPPPLPFSWLRNGASGLRVRHDFPLLLLMIRG
ncbi:hypothetical protein ACFWEG_28310, partial [Streptomyces sp. NPDC060194]